MRIIITSLVLGLCAGSAHAGLPPRELMKQADVANQDALQTVSWARGEAVLLVEDLYYNGKLYDPGTNAVVLWTVLDLDSPTNVYISTIGVRETNWTYQFAVSAEDANLDVGRYRGYVRGYTPSSTNDLVTNMLEFVRQSITVRFTPDLELTNTVAARSFGYETDPVAMASIGNLGNAIGSVESNITAEAASRAIADGLIATNLAAEASARAEADAAASNRLDEVEATRLTSVRCAGGWYNPDYFTLRLTPYPYNIISVGETQAVNSVYVSLITVDSAAGYLLDPAVIRMSTFTGVVTFTALSNCSIAQVTVTNYSVWQTTTQDYFAVIFDAIDAGEYAGISAELNGCTRQTSVVYAVSNELSYYSFQGDVPGSLRAYVNTSLAARAAVSNRTMNLFEAGWPSYGTGGTWTRNTNCWAYGIDLTCVSPYNTQGNQVEKGGTAITRQHVAYADHYSFTNNARLLFVDNTNGQHWRSIIDQRTVPGCDIRIGLLDAPLPETITPAQFLRGADNGRFLGVEELAGLPKLNTVNLKAVEGNDPKVFAKWACFGYAYIDKRGGIIGSGTAPLRSHDDHEYSRSVEIGDSGHPIFIIAGTNTIIHSAWESFMGGPNYGYYAPEIETMLRAMGSTPYTNLHYVNLTAWRDYNTPPTP